MNNSSVQQNCLILIKHHISIARGHAHEVRVSALIVSSDFESYQSKLSPLTPGVSSGVSSP